MRVVFTWLVLLCSGGCVGHGNFGSNAHWPSLDELSSAARSAATDPTVWVPVATAGVLLAADVDDKWSEDLADDQPLFGDDAEDISSKLRDVASGAYVLTALLAPSPTVGDKFKAVSVGMATAALDGVVSYGVKDLVRRERPDGSNDRSMASGHASKAASRTTMARRNLAYMEMPAWTRHTLDISLHTVAVGTGLARVEARKHHLTDVLVGYALGNFIAAFMYEAFLENDLEGPKVSFQPLHQGGALTLTVPVP